MKTERTKDIAAAIQKAIRSQGLEVDCADIHGYIKGIAREVCQMYPGPMGPSGIKGDNGAPGRDGWDKYRRHPQEVSGYFSWKGVDFEAPIPFEFKGLIPEGDLTKEDILFIDTMYGAHIVQRIATFWRREYDMKTDLTAFMEDRS